LVGDRYVDQRGGATEGRNNGAASSVCPPMTELRRALPFLAFVLVVFVAGCALLPPPLRSLGPLQSEPPLTSPTPVGAIDVHAIDAAQAAWDAAGIDDYQLDLGFLCMCMTPPRVIVDVVDGVPTALDDHGRPIDAAKLEFTPVTVEQLLQEARRALDNGGTVVATFDPATGAPTRLELDYAPLAIDDELTIFVNSLTPTGIDRN
jgi:hypothetical protein